MRKGKMRVVKKHWQSRQLQETECEADANGARSERTNGRREEWRTPFFLEGEQTPNLVMQIRSMRTAPYDIGHFSQEKIHTGP